MVVAMPPMVRAVSFAAVLCFLVVNSNHAVAQTSVDDVHIAPREMPIEVATASYTADTFPTRPLIRASANLVMVPVTITDQLNRPILGLDSENFELFENKKPQAIKNFSSEDSPVSIGILLDTSRSMSYKLQNAREAVARFCEEANPQDEFFMITFSDTPRLVTDFTASAEQVENDLLTVTPRGQTSLLDAIYMGLEKMRSARYARRALLIISDGGDNHSRYTERDVKSAIREADVMIYAVGTFERYAPTQEEMLGPDLLRSVSEVTGGHAFTLTNAVELSQVTRNIMSRLRHQYVLAYQPETAPHDGKWHKIKVKLRLPQKFPFLRVEAKAGYYAGGD